jgi:hypothetical protein
VCNFSVEDRAGDTNQDCELFLPEHQSPHDSTGQEEFSLACRKLCEGPKRGTCNLGTTLKILPEEVMCPSLTSKLN